MPIAITHTIEQVDQTQSRFGVIDWDKHIYEALTSNQNTSPNAAFYIGSAPILSKLSKERQGAKNKNNTIHGIIDIEKIKEIQSIYQLVGFDNSEILVLAETIIKHCLSLAKTDLKISRTGENEILIYRQNNGAINNIIIDKDGDIEFMRIGKNRATSFNEYYYAEDNDREIKVAQQL